jgi:hypothetical protein
MMKMLILHRTVKFCGSVGIQFAENFQANWQEEYYFIMTIPDSTQPEQPRRKFKNYSENSQNIHFTARLGP